LIVDPLGRARTLGFTSGEPLAGDASTLCVFVPNAPNPLQGRLLFVDRAHCQMLQTSAEDAFKMLLSTGNFIPEEIAKLVVPETASNPRMEGGG